MPRASWRGFLRLSLVSCPIYLSPATSRTKPIRLHQVWRPASVEEPEGGLPDRGREEQPDERPALRNGAGEEADQTEGATRITLRPHDRATGEEIDKAEVVKGYEYDRGHLAGAVGLAMLLIGPIRDCKAAVRPVSSGESP